MGKGQEDFFLYVFQATLLIHDLLITHPLCFMVPCKASKAAGTKPKIGPRLTTDTDTGLSGQGSYCPELLAKDGLQSASRYTLLPWFKVARRPIAPFSQYDTRLEADVGPFSTGTWDPKSATILWLCNTEANKKKAKTTKKNQSWLLFQTVLLVLTNDSLMQNAWAVAGAKVSSLHLALASKRMRERLLST